MEDKHSLQHIPSPITDLSVGGDASASLIARGRRAASKLMADRSGGALNQPNISKKTGKVEIDEGDLELCRGVLYYHGRSVPQDFEKAAMWFRKAAARGIPAAKYYLGRQYESGEGVTKSYVQAAIWYQQAAKQGYAPAQNNLGLLFDLGDGVPKNFSMAERWFRKAAEQGQPSAQAWLGDNYYYGRGLAKDYSESYFWLYLATLSGSQTNPEIYATIRDAAVKHLTPKEVSAQQKRAHRWLSEHPSNVD
jgi:TPR repeat protein